MEAALAWIADEQAKCKGCGKYRDETMQRDAFRRYDAEPLVCHACQVREQAARAWSQGNNNGDGVYWFVKERERA